MASDEAETSRSWSSTTRRSRASRALELEMPRSYRTWYVALERLPSSRRWLSGAASLINTTLP